MMPALLQALSSSNVVVSSVWKDITITTVLLSCHHEGANTTMFSYRWFLQFGVVILLLTTNLRLAIVTVIMWMMEQVLYGRMNSSILNKS